MILDSDNICGLIDNNLADLIYIIITIIKFGIPILLIIFGMLDFGKSVIAPKEDEMKTGRKMFLKRIISAVLVFFVITIVQLVIGLVDDKNNSDESEVWNCANLILNGKVPNSSGNTNTNKVNKNNTNNNNTDNSMMITEMQTCCIKYNGTVKDGTGCNDIPDDNSYNQYEQCISDVRKKY